MQDMLKKLLTPCMLASTGVSLVSALVFVVYVVIRVVPIPTDQQTRSILFDIGIISAAIAQFLQVFAIALLIVQWFAAKSAKKARELLILLLSLLPYVPLLVMIVVIVLYIWKRHHPEHKKELREIGLDAATNVIESSASDLAHQQYEGSPSPKLQPSSGNPGQVLKEGTQAAAQGGILGTTVSQVVGPVTAGVIGSMSSNIISTIATTTMVATVVTGGTVATGTGMAIVHAIPLSSIVSPTASAQWTPTPTMTISPSTLTPVSPTASSSPTSSPTPLTPTVHLPLQYTLLSAPVAISWGGSHIALFARATTNEIIQRTWNGSSWSAWQSIGGSGITTSRPAVSSWGVGELDVLATGSNGIYHTQYQNGSWSKWTLVRSESDYASAPTSVSTGPNQIDYAVRLTNNEIIHGWYDGSWHQDTSPLTSVVQGLLSPPGAMMGDPTIAISPPVANPPSGISLAIMSNCGGGLCYNVLGSTWVGWNIYSYSYTHTADPTSVRRNASYYDFVVQDPSDYQHCWYYAGWWACETIPLGGSSAFSPALSSDGVSRLDLFVVGSDRKTIYQNHFDGSWHGWTTIW
jgi:hypothetical protein